MLTRSSTAIDAAIAEVAASLRRSTWQVFPRGGHGSALAAGRDLLITNAHVARRGPVQAEGAGGDVRRGEIVARAEEL
ncbi:MAG TPA: hypothetical protein VEJ20_02995, partial [Candidatus Eremiobacteraceae bacterium]|nr:hypothetical protein [Candidatus Eremiobacteraceae bacterium]